LLTGFGSLTPVGSLARSVGLRLTDSYAGIVLAQTFVASPFVVVTARSGFAGVDDQLEEAARSLGSGPVATFWNVSVPLARNSILAGIVLTFARAVGEFGATMMVAYHPHTMPVQIWVAFGSRGLDATVPLVVLLALIGFSVVFALHTLGRTPTLTR
jgi:molybdate/tungstate transport system permease protein